MCVFLCPVARRVQSAPSIVTIVTRLPKGVIPLLSCTAGQAAVCAGALVSSWVGEWPWHVSLEKTVSPPVGRFEVELFSSSRGSGRGDAIPMRGQPQSPHAARMHQTAASRSAPAQATRPLVGSCTTCDDARRWKASRGMLFCVVVAVMRDGLKRPVALGMR